MVVVRSFTGQDLFFSKSRGCVYKTTIKIVRQTQFHSTIQISNENNDCSLNRRLYGDLFLRKYAFRTKILQFVLRLTLIHVDAIQSSRISVDDFIKIEKSDPRNGNARSAKCLRTSTNLLC